MNMVKTGKLPRKYTLDAEKRDIIIGFLEGRKGFDETAKSLGCSKQGVYMVITNIVKLLTEAKRVDAKKLIDKY